NGQAYDVEGEVFLFSSRGRHTRFSRDWSSDVCSSDLSLWLEPRHRDAAAMLSRGISRTFNQKPSGALATAALRADRYGFVGYARSEERRVGKGGRYGGAARP